MTSVWDFSEGVIAYVWSLTGGPAVTVARTDVVAALGHLAKMINQGLQLGPFGGE